MKKILACLLLLTFILAASGCAKKEATVVSTFAETPAELVEEYVENGGTVTTVTYYEMSDGTFATDEHDYKYRLTVSGRLGGSAADVTYTILSNIKTISFEEAWKASGLSSDSADYFAPEDAVFVAVKLG